jgi:predicted dienelactone hydrolase
VNYDLGVPRHRPNRHSTLLFCTIFISTVMPAARSAPNYLAGYESLRIVDDARKRPIQLDVWYPAATTETERDHRYGLSTGHVTSGAAVAGTPHPLLLLSPGAMGTASNYSWLAEDLSRHGYVVLGVSHIGESPVFGAASLDPSAVGRFGDRTRDLNFALGYVLERSAYAKSIDPTRIGAIGHSSGGASVLMLAGAEFSAADLAAYCASPVAGMDKGCSYPAGSRGDPGRTVPVRSERRIRALVALDPAVGPGFTDRGLRAFRMPSLVIGSVQNDFLPYPYHAGRIARIRDAQVERLDHGEGHFVYVDECALPIDVMGVPLCKDRPGVDRRAVHTSVAAIVERFLERHL